MYKLVHYRFRGGPINVYKDKDGFIPLFLSKQDAYKYSKDFYMIFPECFKGKITKKHKLINPA